MMRLCIVLAFFLATHFAEAQYIVPVVQKDNFSKDLLQIINDVPQHFNSLKGRAIKSSGSGKAFKSKVRIKGWQEGYIVEKSETERVCYYPLANVPSLEEASAYIDQTIDKISQSMSRRVMLNKSDTVEDNKDNVLLQSRLAYMNHNGFYNYNIYVEALQKDTSYLVQLRVKGGTPKFYYWVPKNEPTGSPLFVLGFRKNLMNFERYNLYDCEVDLPGFRCNKEVDTVNYMVTLRYTKQLYEMPNAMYEYKVAVANIKAAMGQDYLYTNRVVDSTIVRQAEFIRASDVEKTKRKHIVTTLSRKEDGNHLLEVAFYYE